MSPLSALPVLTIVVLAACAGPREAELLRAAPGPGGSGTVAALEALDVAGIRALEAYAVAAPNKAFAVAPDGAWGWQAGAAGVATAEQQALERCAAVSASGPCRVMAWDAAANLGASSADTAAPSTAGGQPFGATPPLDDPGVAAFQTFLAVGGNKAFAVSPDGAWGWRASTALPLEDVQQQARDNCAQHGDGCAVVVTAPDVEALAALPR